MEARPCPRSASDSATRQYPFRCGAWHRGWKLMSARRRQTRRGRDPASPASRSSRARLAPPEQPPGRNRPKRPSASPWRLRLRYPRERGDTSTIADVARRSRSSARGPIGDRRGPGTSLRAFADPPRVIRARRSTFGPPPGFRSAGVAGIRSTDARPLRRSSEAPRAIAAARGRQARPTARRRSPPTHSARASRSGRTRPAARARRFATD
jgi:hypothetical protein